MTLRPYYIFSSGRIMRRENTIYVENEKGEKKALPIEEVESLHIFGEVEMNTKFLNFLSQHGKPIHFYNYYGFYSGSFVPRSKNISGELLVKQVEYYLDNEKRLYLAKAFVEGATFHMLRNLRNYDGTEEFVRVISEEQVKWFEAKTVLELMGCEGRAREAYYQAFNTITCGRVTMNKREKRPPKDPINALISFGNSVMYSVVLSEIYKTELNPTISYLHEPRERRFSLSLDISEIFKPLIVDPTIFKLINNSMLKEEDFEDELDLCYLTSSGKKKFLKEFEEKLETTIKHRKLKRSVSYRTLIRLECYKLIRHLLQDELYKPLKAWW